MLVISMAFFKNKYFLTKASRYYVLCLMLTLVTAVANVAFAVIREYVSLPLWLVGAITTVEYILPVLAFSILCLYFVAKVVDHMDNDKILRSAGIAVAAVFLGFFALTIVNVLTGFAFSIDASGERALGPVWFVNYVFMLAEIGVVAFHCVRYRKNLSRAVMNALSQSVATILFCVIFKIAYRDIDLPIFLLCLVESVFFLNFQNQRVGVNTLTRLNDSRRFLLEIEKRMNQGLKFKVFAIRIENIGIVNQVWGHRAGDEVMYLFAFALERLFDAGVAFHMHGTTFAVVLPESKTNDETEIMEAFLKNPIEYEKDEIELVTSLVEKDWSGESTDVNAFYDKIEYALSIVSESKIDYLRYTPEIGEQMQRQKYVMSRLAHIDREHGFEIWFQPIFNVDANCFGTMETLIRLREPDGGMISPAEFIPLAEKTGLIIPITWFVVEEVCRALSENECFDGVRVSINLPMLHLLDPAFPAKVTEIVDRYGVDHSRLAFEFTERTIFDDLNTAEGNMRKLVHYGYSFYLDDFGVGYSNFNCVMQLPISTVKLDMSLTSTVESLEGNYNLVNILTDLFHDMGLTVTAEGAETAEQIELLKKYGVDFIQGYYYSKPMPIDKAVEFFKNRKADAVNQ